MSAVLFDWITNLQRAAHRHPLWLWGVITLAYILALCAYDGVVLAVGGFAQGSFPLWQSGLWWTEIVNGALLGFIPAALVYARRGIEADAKVLAPMLDGASGSAAADFCEAAGRSAGWLGSSFKIVGVVAGILLVFFEPSITLNYDRSLSNPSFFWVLVRLPLFAWLTCGLLVADLIATRAYFELGRNMQVADLLEIGPLSQFGRRGLRSALIWMTFSIVFSLFWLDVDTAARQNIYLLVGMLVMATGSFVVPLLGVHATIRSRKLSELDRLKDEIVLERAIVLEEPSQADQSSPRLANLIAYYQLIENTREWPIDAANLLRFILYLVIGLGSWLGGALVEVLLNRSLGG